MARDDRAHLTTELIDLLCAPPTDQQVSPVAKTTPNESMVTPKITTIVCSLRTT
jgi:hypothetical protein